MEEKAHGLTQSMNELMNDEAVYKTAPATPGLLIFVKLHFIILKLTTFYNSDPAPGSRDKD